ncbi:MAG TPA: hypothetical protein VEK77_05545 [Gemmatimonadales bacterium]|nr:hypothetical protein [Gemmatimonadales bacterium]
MRAKSLSLLALVLAAPLAAQSKEQLCNDLQHRPMRVGQWSSYTWTGGRSDGTTMRMAVVGTEAVEGQPYYWYEMLMNDPKKGPKGRNVFQMLVPGLGFQPGAVRALIVKSGDEPAMRMPDEMVRMMGGRMGQNLAADLAGKCLEMTVVGWEQVTVPAGSFRALHVRSANDQNEGWVVPDLYFGMVRAKLKDGSTMDLTGRGTDAKSSITETPRSMPSPH